jgi:hypothetical protein
VVISDFSRCFIASRFGSPELIRCRIIISHPVRQIFALFQSLFSEEGTEFFSAFESKAESNSLGPPGNANEEDDWSDESEGNNCESLRKIFSMLDMQLEKEMNNSVKSYCSSVDADDSQDRNAFHDVKFVDSQDTLGNSDYSFLHEGMPDRLNSNSTEDSSSEFVNFIRSVGSDADKRSRLSSNFRESSDESSLLDSLRPKYYMAEEYSDLEKELDESHTKNNFVRLDCFRTILQEDGL